MKKLIWLIVFVFLFSACGNAPTPEVVTSQVTQLVTQEVTKEVTREVTREVTHQVVVTATYSGPTATVTPSLTPSPTIDLTKTDKKDGSFMVGTEITPGIWRSSGGDPKDKCWIQIKTLSGDLVDIAGDLPGGTIRIPTGQYIVYIGGGSGNLCTWTFLTP